MSKISDSRGLIKSMLIIGLAQVINILISIFRMKLLAVLLGPSGVGLLSIYNSLLNILQQTAGLGMEASGVREIASSRGEETILSRVRRVIVAAHLLQGTLAMLAVWLMREQVAIWLFGDTLRATEIGLIGIAILVSLLTVAQTALLQGLQKIDDLGRITVFGAFISTAAGLFAIWLQGESGLILFILVQPLASYLVALRYTRRLPQPATSSLSLMQIWRVWKSMAKLGAGFMLGGMAGAVTLFLVRGQISQELGLNAAGYFAAAWSITMTYLGFLLSAMATDYYPRLTGIIHDKVKAVGLINDQAQLSLAIGGPVLLLFMGLAPWVTTVLFSSEFAPTVPLIQWQMVGNVFKLASWALSFSIIAAARAKTFLIMELSYNMIFWGVVVVFLPRYGLEVTAYAFVLSYLVYLIIGYILARWVHGFRWQSLSLSILAVHTCLSIVLLVLVLMAPRAGALTSLLLFATTSVFGLRIVLNKIGKQGRVPTKLYSFFAVLGWPIRSEVHAEES